MQHPTEYTSNQKPAAFGWYCLKTQQTKQAVFTKRNNTTATTFGWNDKLHFDEEKKKSTLFKRPALFRIVFLSSFCLQFSGFFYYFTLMCFATFLFFHSLSKFIVDIPRRWNFFVERKRYAY